ncbi:Hypothetical protein UVM_LOCUS487 [uncultured virus]|nr:Hypothetical protein UVM_LOCUS487 [uncultured virus]
MQQIPVALLELGTEAGALHGRVAEFASRLFNVPVKIEDVTGSASSGGSPAATVQTFLRQYAGGSRLFVGPNRSETILALQPHLAQRRDAVFLSSASTAVGLAWPNDGLFRLSASDRWMADALRAEIARLTNDQPQRATVLAQRGDPWATELAQALGLPWVAVDVANQPQATLSAARIGEEHRGHHLRASREGELVVALLSDQTGPYLDLLARTIAPMTTTLPSHMPPLPRRRAGGYAGNTFEVDEWLEANGGGDHDGGGEAAGAAVPRHLFGDTAALFPFASNAQRSAAAAVRLRAVTFEGLFGWAAERAERELGERLSPFHLNTIDAVWLCAALRHLDFRSPELMQRISVAMEGAIGPATGYLTVDANGDRAMPRFVAWQYEGASDDAGGWRTAHLYAIEPRTGVFDAPLSLEREQGKEASWIERDDDASQSLVSQRRFPSPPQARQRRRRRSLRAASVW